MVCRVQYFAFLLQHGELLVFGSKDFDCGDALASLEQRNAEIEKDNGEKWLRIASLEQQVTEKDRLLALAKDEWERQDAKRSALETAPGSPCFCCSQGCSHDGCRCKPVEESGKEPSRGV